MLNLDNIFEDWDDEEYDDDEISINDLCIGDIVYLHFRYSGFPTANIEVRNHNQKIVKEKSEITKFKGDFIFFTSLNKSKFKWSSTHKDGIIKVTRI